jgi:hypothetical protein
MPLMLMPEANSDDDEREIKLDIIENYYSPAMSDGGKYFQ